ncbi:MAG: molybdopterin synthase sulfur carrier subunit [Planctomycetaceae bacterium]|nr:MAG: molybdopterin synthase sulfur carrier subunit [Planctomycetaceae bacterium]
MQDNAMQIDPTPLARGNATLRISLFAGMADLAGCRAVEIEWAGGSVALLRSSLAAALPAIEPLLGRSAVAVGGVYATNEATVPCDAEVAIIPPVSGG